jgi:hypothetical protein
MNDIRRRIDEIEAGGVDEKKKLLELETAVAKFETVLHQNNLGVANMPPLPPRSPINAAMNFGMQKYTSIPVLSLAIYACPHNWDRLPDDGAGRKAALIADDKVRCTAWANNFKRGVPSAHILMIPNADHYVYRSATPNHQPEFAREVIETIRNDTTTNAHVRFRRGLGIAAIALRSQDSAQEGLRVGA